MKRNGKTTRNHQQNGSSSRSLASSSAELPCRALVTGGAGFIGTNVAARLAAEGCQVVILDNLSREGVDRNLRWLRSQFPRQIEFVRGDVRDRAAVNRAIQGCDTVFHFAAQVAVTTSLLDPETDFEVNAHGTLNVLEACRECRTPPRLLFTSTNKVYGNLPHLPLRLLGGRYRPEDVRWAENGIDETCPLSFHSPYGCSKGTADQYVLDYARCWDLPAVVFRMSCIYGPHQCGTEDQGWVAFFARQIMRGDPITIFGDGYQVRDILYVEDLVDAMLGAVGNMQTTRGRTFNVGGGPSNAVSLREVLERLGQLHAATPDIRFADWREGDQRYYVSNPSRLGKAIGWSPQVSAEEGIAHLYHWIKADASVASARIAVT